MALDPAVLKVRIDRRVHEHLQNWLWKAIDQPIEQWWDVKCEPLKDGIGGALGTVRRQLREEFKHAIEEAQDAVATEFAALEQRLALNNQAALVSWIDGHIEAALAHEHDAFKRAIEEMQRSFETKLAALEERLRAVPGKLPVSKIWRPESVTYAAEVASYDGSLWQACKDTAQVPGGSDWVCVARAGRDGCDGLTPNVRGTFNVHKTYARLDVVEFDNASYVARRDDPGLCPGDGWQISSRSGRRGPVGERGERGRIGERGARGEATPTIVSCQIDPVHYRAVPTMSDGTFGAPLDLRPLFEAYHVETSSA